MKKVPIVILITALCIGLFLLLSTCSDDPHHLKPDKESIQNAKHEAGLVEAHYQNAFINLKIHSDSLEKALGKTQKQLIATKIKLEQSKFSVVKLLEKDTAGLSVQQKLNDCDSLKEEVSDYVFWVDSTQSNYETTISQLHTIVAVRDSEIVVCQISYTQLKSISDDNLQRERKLTEDLQTAYKQQRKKQVQNKVLAVGFLILSAVTTSLLIQSRQ
ncbi:MAG: hypothetical protein ABIP51_00285 [Bacteroidia bacterium]